MIGFGIVFGLFITFVFFVWFSRQGQSYNVVLAGNVEHVEDNISLTTVMDLSRFDFVFENKSINPLDYTIFVVSGNSMSMAEIHKDDVIFVQKLSGADALKINDSAVLVFEIDKRKDKKEEQNKSKSPVKFKLRKFISYVDGNLPFENWFNELKEKHAELSEKATDIKESFEKCVEKYKVNNDNSENISLIFSKTGEDGYSFHPMKFLYGKVEYSVKAEDI